MSFDKFTDKARKVLVLAQDEARSLPDFCRWGEPFAYYELGKRLRLQ